MQEYFGLIYKGKADADDFNYSAWAKGHIIDDATLSLGLSNYTYSVTGANIPLQMLPKKVKTLLLPSREQKQTLVKMMLLLFL